MSKKYGKTPSNFLGIKDDYTAFCLDEACLYIENKLASNHEFPDKKQKNELLEFLRETEKPKNQPN